MIHQMNNVRQLHARISALEREMRDLKLDIVDLKFDIETSDKTILRHSSSRQSRNKPEGES